MNKFLLERFPLNYARIYKAFLQHRGRILIQQALEQLSSGLNLENLFEDATKNRSRDVYLALHALNYLEKCGYAYVLKPISEALVPFPIDPMEVVLIQMIRSKRWQNTYETEEGKEQFDLILALPKWSRVVSVSTTEIQPQELVRKLRQFDTLWLSNYHFYEFFNKLHGVPGRDVRLEEKDNVQRVRNLDKLGFLYRTCNDAKAISKSANMKFFTIVPDINGNIRVGFYFLIICKITDVKDSQRRDGSGIDPYNFRLVGTDESGSLEIFLNTKNFVDSFRSRYLENELNDFLQSRTRFEGTITHPYDLKAHQGYVLLLCNWFLGDDTPNLSFGALLGPDVNAFKFHFIGYLNTRKKVRYSEVKKKWGEQCDSVVASSRHVKTSSEDWCNYKEDAWDENMFRIMVERHFIMPAFHERLRLGIAGNQLQEWMKYTSIYFAINEFSKQLYTAVDPESAFREVYTEIAPSSLDPERSLPGSTDTLSSRGQHQDMDIQYLVPIKDWLTLNGAAQLLRKRNCTASLIFSWNNGGVQLESRWFSIRMRKHSGTDEILSALAFILQARGTVLLPHEIAMSM